MIRNIGSIYATNIVFQQNVDVVEIVTGVTKNSKTELKGVINMKVAKIYLTMIDMLLDYLETEKETLLEKDCDINLLGYYKLTKEYIEDRMAEELSLMWWRLEFDLKEKAKEERGFPKQAYDDILPLFKRAKEFAINFCLKEQLKQK